MNSANEIVTPLGIKNATFDNHGFVAVTSLKCAGNMSFRRGLRTEVAINETRFLESLAINLSHADLCVLNTAQSTNVVFLGECNLRTGRRILSTSSPGVEKSLAFKTYHLSQPHHSVDAAFAHSLNQYLAVLAADCAPVFICDPITGLYGITHVGAIGALSGLMSQTIDCILALSNARLSNLLFYIGPCATQPNYKLTESLVYDSVFNQIDWESARRFDLKTSIVNELINNGVSYSNIETSRFCTVGDSSLFFSNGRARSYKAKQLEGRHMCLIGRKVP